MTTLSLHCFPGQSLALPIVLLGDYLGLNLNIKQLKPINLKEKQYKSTVSKLFPLLEIAPTVFIEKTPAILRYIARNYGQNLYNEKNDSCCWVDQNLDLYFYQTLPTLLTFLAVKRHVLDMDSKEIAIVKKDLCTFLKNLDTAMTVNLEVELNLFDFVLFSMLNLVDSDMNKFIKNLKNIKKRWTVVEKDEKFRKLFQNIVRSVLN